MKRARAVIVSLLFVLLGAGVLAYSQQEQLDDRLVAVPCHQHAFRGGKRE